MEIVKEASWSNAGTFAKFYNKPIMRENFGDTLLKQLVNSNGTLRDRFWSSKQIIYNVIKDFA